jgi:hypothetical protein
VCRSEELLENIIAEIMNGSDDDDDEILIQEHTAEAAPYDPLPAGCSQTQPEDLPRANASFVPLLTRQERQRREMQNRFHSPQLSPEDDDEPPVNEFASLEAMLESQEGDQAVSETLQTASREVEVPTKETESYSQATAEACQQPDENPAGAAPTNADWRHDEIVQSHAIESSGSEKAPHRESYGEDLSQRRGTQVTNTRRKASHLVTTLPRSSTTTPVTSLLNTTNATTLLEKSRRYAMKQAKAGSKAVGATKKPKEAIAVSNLKSIVGSR